MMGVCYHLYWGAASQVIGHTHILFASVLFCLLSFKHDENCYTERVRVMVLFGRVRYCHCVIVVWMEW